MRRRRVWRSVRAIGAVMGMALAATALAAQAPPGAAAPSEPPMDAAAAKELIAHVRATYAKAPKLHSSVRYVLNSAHKGIDAGTLGMGELRVNADRAARTLSMIGRTASDFSAIADGATLEIYNPEAPSIVLSLPLGDSMSAKPLVKAFRTIGKDGIVPAPWMATELALFLDGDLGLEVPLERFGPPTADDAPLLERFRILEKYRLVSGRDPAAAPLTVLTAGDAENRYVIGIDRASGRIPIVLFVGDGERVGLGPRRVEFLLAGADMAAAGNAETARPQGESAPERVRSVEEYAERLRRMRLELVASEAESIEKALAELEKTAAALPKDDPNRAYFDESIALTRRVIEAAKALQR